MNKVKQIALYALGITLLLTSCKKEVDLPIPQKPGSKPVPDSIVNRPPVTPPVPDTLVTVRIKAAISIGGIVYDSIPAMATITTWDSTQRSYEKTVSLSAGTNEIKVPKTHVKFHFKISQWGVQDEVTLTRQQLDETGIIRLGGSKAAKKLTLEESFIYAAGEYRPRGKTIYHYHANGTLKSMDFYQKKVEESELRKTSSHHFFYVNNRVDEIKYFDGFGKQFGYLKFIYNEEGKIENMEQKSYGQTTYAHVYYAYADGAGSIGIDFLFDNGHAMEYIMSFKGGNKVEDKATTSRGGGEGGKYDYDVNINPYVHLNIPNLYLSHTSKNNMIGRQKGYSGAIPTNEPYKYEYSYDGDGYPKELIKSYQSIEGQHLYHIKTVYTY